MTTEDDLENAIRAHAIANGNIDDDQLIVNWTLAGSAVDPGRDNGVQVFYMAPESHDPMARLGLATLHAHDLLNPDNGDDW